MRGIGTDIIEIGRIKRACQRHAFLERCFTEHEIEYFTIGASKELRYESVAACFAAKEAFAKALGTGIGEMSFKDIEVRHTDAGQPYICLDGTPKKNCFLSMSHCKEYATATVFVE